MAGFIRLGIIIFAITLAVAGASRAESRESPSCLSCHGTAEQKLVPQMDGAILADSVHGAGLDCADCHVDAASRKHPDEATTAKADCSRCHEMAAVHGAGNGQEPVSCVSCHGGHGVFHPDDRRSTLHSENLAKTCGACHPEQAGEGLSVASVLSFRIKGHGKADMSGAYDDDCCLACHMAQADHGMSDTVQDASCVLCHNKTSTLAPILGSVHGSAGTPKKTSPNTWGDAAYLICLAAAGFLFIGGWASRVYQWSRGGAEDRFDKPWQRLKGCAASIFGQKKTFSRKPAGLAHYLILVGVSAPVFAILTAQASPTLHPSLAGVISFLLDIAGLGLLAGVGLALWLRVAKAQDYRGRGLIDLSILILLGSIAVSGFLVEGSRLAMLQADWSWQHPLGWVAAQMLSGSGDLVKTIWRIHFLLVLVFAALIPFTRLRHIFTSTLNAYFRKLDAPMVIKPEDVDAKGNFGLEKRMDMSWKDRLDADACTSCARCQEACPAFRTEKPLSPMNIMRAGLQAGDYQLAGQVVSPDELWACTTCGACEAACPVCSEPMAKVTGMRRAMVLNHGKAPAEAVPMLRNLEAFGDPFGTGRSRRTDWMAGLENCAATVTAKDQTILWVGCQGAFHPRATEAVRALTRLAQRAGAPLTVLGGKEACCGDPARRLGDEALFQEMAKSNIDFLSGINAGKIVTLCPHCLNVLKNEYRQFGGGFEVFAAVEWALKLLNQGDVAVKRRMAGPVVYHDPCYLARGAGLVNQPRRLAEKLWEGGLMEASEKGAGTFCCGGGGGGMWLHESGKRINLERVKQLQRVGAETVATACPYCLAMLEDAMGGEEKPTPVVELIEVLEWATR